MTNLALYRGDGRALDVDASEDLTDHEVMFTARRRPGAAAHVIRKTVGAGVEVSGDTATITLDPADTADLDPCTLRWDLQITDNDDSIPHTVASGQLVIMADVSR